MSFDTRRPALSLPTPTLLPPTSLSYSEDIPGRKCGHDKKKQSYAAPKPTQGGVLQPPPVPDKPQKPVKEPAGEAKGYEEIRARLGKGK